ncbi:hypothetical protein [Breoghania sp.]|nr:hypothetical protein [Breoghania sp.]MDJ0931559.1 hypothetical protein [Breoghania sp.]
MHRLFGFLAQPVRILVFAGKAGDMGVFGVVDDAVQELTGDILPAFRQSA